MDDLDLWIASRVVLHRGRGVRERELGGGNADDGWALHFFFFFLARIDDVVERWKTDLLQRVAIGLLLVLMLLLLVLVIVLLLLLEVSGGRVGRDAPSSAGRWIRRHRQKREERER